MLLLGLLMTNVEICCANLDTSPRVDSLDVTLLFYFFCKTTLGYFYNNMYKSVELRCGFGVYLGYFSQGGHKSYKECLVLQS